ncbi:MAG: hypothetical protein ACI4I7_05815, partial [Oscillospiraceae bacterium]
MRKVLAYVCCAAEYASMAVAAVFSYKAYMGDIPFELGLMIFIPVMIMSYWFSTFFYQLSSVKCIDGKSICIINKRLKKILSAVSTIVTFVLMAFWVYIFL